MTKHRELAAVAAVCFSLGNVALVSTSLAVDDVAGVFSSVFDDKGKQTARGQDDPGNEVWEWDDRYDHWYDEWALFDVEKALEHVRYNRVEGLFLGVGSGAKQIGTSHFLFFGSSGYGFKSKAWRYQLGLSTWWGEPHRSEIGVITYDLTDTVDRWLLPTIENSLAAILFRDDFYDFFRRCGTSLFVHQDVLQNVRLSAEYRADRYENMSQKAHWSLLGGDRGFRANPSILAEIPEDEMRSVLAGFTFDTRDDHYVPRQGWRIRGEYEYAGRSLQGDFDFDRLVLDIRRYQPVANEACLDSRIRLASVKQKSEHMPASKLFDLGGIGTLRGYRFKELHDATKLMLGNIEYRIWGDKIASRDRWFFESLAVSFFGDAGWASHSFADLALQEVNTDVGVGLTDDDQDWRIDFAKRLDQSEGITVTFRINRVF